MCARAGEEAGSERATVNESGRAGRKKERNRADQHFAGKGGLLVFATI